MIAKHKHVLFALAALVIVAGTALDASAYCASCGVPAASYSYAAPATYTAAYAPAYTTAYAPTYSTAYYAPTYSSGWYPGYYMDRMRANWGARRAYTAAYPVTYSAGYASTAYYAPSVSYASYTPGCSSCGTTAYYAPACSSCSTCAGGCASPCSSCSACTASYVPACTGCATGCSDCGVATTVVTQASYVEPAAPCANCAATTTAVTTPAPATTTYETPSSQPQPTLAPSENPAAVRGQESQKPVVEPAPAQETTPIEPVPQSDSSEESATFEAPMLLNPNDRTAERHKAPVWTAVYHKQVEHETKPVQTVSHRQAEMDADGWVSASE